MEGRCCWDLKWELSAPQVVEEKLEPHTGRDYMELYLLFSFHRVPRHLR